MYFFLIRNILISSVCLRSLLRFYIATRYSKLGKTSWTNNRVPFRGRTGYTFGQTWRPDTLNSFLSATSGLFQPRLNNKRVVFCQWYILCFDHPPPRPFYPFLMQFSPFPPAAIPHHYSILHNI